MAKHVLVAALVVGSLMWTDATAQGCDVCTTPPRPCYILRFGIPGCCDSVEAVFCYECSPTHPEINIYVASVTYCPGCEDAVWDYIWDWVLNNEELLCAGARRPCDQPPFLDYYITRPICAEVSWNTVPYLGRLRVKIQPGECDLRCTLHLQVCRDFSTVPPTVRTDTLSYYVTGNGIGCQELNYYDENANPQYGVEPGKSWSIPCTRVMCNRTTYMECPPPRQCP